MRKRIIKVAFICLLIVLSSGSSHKFYVSITQIDINPLSHKLEISSRIFTDDLEYSIIAQSGIKLWLGSNNEHPKADSLLFDFLNSNLIITQDSSHLDFIFIGQEVDADVTCIYAESKEGVQINDPIEISNSLLFDQFPDQKNIVNLSFGKNTTSQIHTNDHISYMYQIKLK